MLLAGSSGVLLCALFVMTTFILGLRKTRTILLSPLRHLLYRYNPRGATMLKLDAKWAAFFANQPETGMDYTVVSVFLRNGRRFDQVVMSGGYLTRIRGYPNIPFSDADISHFVVTHDKWRW
jgi:hypothetical protein